jgi:hypothetical protein
VSAPRRPWKVFVRDIGPSYSFASEQAARDRASALVGPEFSLGHALVGNWSNVLVYNLDGDIDQRWTYKPGQEPLEERWTPEKGWLPVLAKVVASRP